MCGDTTRGVQSPWLRIVGIGADGWQGLSPAAQAVISSATLLVGGQRHLDAVPAMTGQARMAWPSPIHDAFDALLGRRGEPICVLATGDPFWFGIGATLTRYVDPREMEVWPHSSAFSLAASRMGWPLQQTVCISVHGRSLTRVVPELHASSRLLVLSWDGTTARALSSLLCERGFGRSEMTALENMGAADETRRAATAADWGDALTADLTVLAIDCVADAQAVTMSAVAGRPESLFDNDGQISRREVRAVALSLLAPGRNELLWDIGAGSGAIGIEWMLSHPGHRAIAIEPRPDRAERIARNADYCGVPALDCVNARAPECLRDLAAPDAVFIGGGLSAPELLPVCWRALKTGGRIVAASVTVEGDTLLAQAMAGYGGTLTRLAVERSEALGRFRGWTPFRTVTLWHAVKPGGERRSHAGERS